MSWRQAQIRYQMEHDGQHVPYDQRYWTAQVCLAGHVQNGGVRLVPEEKFCECGAETISKCPACQSNIKGANRSYADWKDTPPRGCLRCGTPYPWTKTALEKVNQAIKESGLSEPEKREASSDLDSIIRSYPDAESAAQRTRGRMAKAGEAFRSAYRDYVVPLLAETIAKVLIEK